MKKVFDSLRTDAIINLYRGVLKGDIQAIKLALELSGDIVNRPETTDFEFEVIDDFKKDENS